MADFKPLSRDQLAEAVGKDHEIIRRFEKMFVAAGDTIPANITIIFRLLEELSILIGTTEGKANQANSSVSYISQIVDLLASAPAYDPSVVDTLSVVVRALDEFTGTINAKANQSISSIAELGRMLEVDPGTALARCNQLSDSLLALARSLEIEPGLAIAKANQVADALVLLGRNIETDGGNALARANQVSDALANQTRSVEVATTNPQFNMPRTFSIDYIDWDENPPHANQTRRMEWNPDDDTLNLHHSDGVTQQMGQELYGRITNNTGVTIANGVCLGINPATNSYVLFIANGTLSPITIVGVTTQSIPNGTQGRITVWGRVRDIDTTGAPYGEVWTAGQVLYVSTTIAGGFTNVKPTAPNLSLPIAQVITVNATTGQIAVRPTVEQQLFYGSFVKTTDQVPTLANTANAITWDSSLTANGVSIGAPASRIVCANAGLYKFSASFQLTSSSASVKNVWFWFRKNGVDIANTSMITSLDSGTAIRTPSRSLFFSMAAGDYLELMFASDSVNCTLDNIAATAFAPAAPAAILTVNQEQQ